MILLIMLLVCTQSICAQEWSPKFYTFDANDETIQLKAAMREIPKLRLRGNETVLDVGCGDGKISSHIVKHFLPHGFMHGIDISEKMINHAQKNYANKNTTFECVSLFDYKPTKKYDVIVSFWVLFLVDDFIGAVNNIVSWLKPGGKALIGIPLEPGSPFLEVFKNAIAPQQMAVKMPVLKNVMTTISAVPAKIDYLEIKHDYVRYENFNTLIEDMIKIPFFQSLPKEKENDFYQKLATAYTVEPDGSVTDNTRIMCMILEKK